jgi:hypothetical protein
MSSTIDKEDPVVGYKCKDNTNGAVPKIKGNANIETIYPKICAASGNYFAKIRDLIKKDASTELRSVFLNPWYVQTDNYFRPIPLSSRSL